MNFPIQPVPVEGGPHVIPQRPFVDPAGIIMQAAQLRQQRDLEQQRMTHESIQSLVQSMQTASDLSEKKREANLRDAVAQQQLEIQRGELPIHEAQARLLNLQADALTGGANPNFYKPDQAAIIINGTEAKQDSVQKTEDTLKKMYPNSLIPKDTVHQMAMTSRFNIGQNTKTDQFTENQWEKLNEQGNPLVAGSRKPVGMAATNNMRLSSIRATLMTPNVTDQQISQAVTDLGAVMKGGNPDEKMVSSQMYSTLQSKYNKFMTNITGTPQLARQPGVVQQLLNVAGELQGVNNQYLDGHFSSLRSSYSGLIAKDPQRYLQWETPLKSMFAGGSTLNPNPQTQSATSQGVNTLLNAAGMSNPAVNVGSVRVKHPNGAIGIIPSSDLPEALNSGYEQIQ